MSEQNKQNKEIKRQYSRIPIKVGLKLQQKRMLLVKQVLKRGKPLNEIIQQLNIKINTARFILNKYKESGAFPRRKFRKTTQIRKQSLLKEKNQEEQVKFGQENQENGKETQGADKGEVILKQEQVGGMPFYLYWYYYPLGQ